MVFYLFYYFTQWLNYDSLTLTGQLINLLHEVKLNLINVKLPVLVYNERLSVNKNHGGGWRYVEQYYEQRPMDYLT